MSRITMRVAALSLIAVFLVGGYLIFNPFGESIEHQRDSRAAKMSPLPKALSPVVAESMGRDDASYHINISNDVGTAETPRHGLKTEFGKDGVAFNAGGNSVELQLTSLGRGDQTAPVAGVSDVTAKDNRLEYKRGDVAEWYMNSPMGMERDLPLTRDLKAPQIA